MSRRLLTVARRKLRMLDDAEKRADMAAVPGNRLAALSGDRARQDFKPYPEMNPRHLGPAHPRRRKYTLAYTVGMAARTSERITTAPGVCGGRACIAGHRVRVLDIVIWHEHQGLAPDEIVSHVPSITLADVHAALAYYYDHREEIQEEIRGERAQAEQFSRDNPSLLATKLSHRGLEEAS